MNHWILPKLWSVEYLQNGLKLKDFSLFLWILRSLNFFFFTQNHYSMYQTAEKNLKKPKFEVDKIRRSATNGNFELVVYQLCGGTCKVVDTSTAHQFFVQKWSNTKFVLMGCVIHFCFCLLWAILIRKFYQLIQQECSKLGWFSLFLT